MLAQSRYYITCANCEGDVICVTHGNVDVIILLVYKIFWTKLIQHSQIEQKIYLYFINYSGNNLKWSTFIIGIDGNR